MNYVPDETHIPSNDLDQITTRLLNQLTSMSEADRRTVLKSEASLRFFVSELFRSIAQLLGYVVGRVVGFGTAIVRAFEDGWEEGRKAGLGK
ncbi:hypothetical protein NIES4075_12550 [Tolypothrix sp. NIES-4075]|uniref:hypothetical protein n=1 Tax=Tolypothrix sp. NIES-4075 TaxID=2005459 RepID=UPI000B5D0805|nr:hypothetical protein [Tolypothrix sp. NIES-4075]GAX40291.1 hypothetical protein NIES4075_12550 [Tolypothrix sp. NIES-4075]